MTGSSSCTSASASTSISFVTSPNADPCDQMAFNVTGGTAPYVLSIVNVCVEPYGSVQRF